MIPNFSPEVVIIHDLKEITITWPFTCYGLNTSWENGSNILVGDISPEELRLNAYVDFLTHNNLVRHETFCKEKLQVAQQSRSEILSDPQKAAFRAQLHAVLHRAGGVTEPEMKYSTTPMSQQDITAPLKILNDSDFTFGNIPSAPPI